MGQAAWRTVRRRSIWGRGRDRHTQVASFMNTNREEMPPPPGLVVTYDREPVVQS